MSKDTEKREVTVTNPQTSMIVLILLFVLFYNFDGYDIDLYDAILSRLTF
jgi:hypothetical protein